MGVCILSLYSFGRGGSELLDRMHGEAPGCEREGWPAAHTSAAYRSLALWPIGPPRILEFRLFSGER